MKLLDQGERLRHEDFQELLQKFLPSLPNSVLLLLEEIHELRRRQPGEMLMEIGKGVDGVFVLRRGAAKTSPLLQSDCNVLHQISAPGVLGLGETILGELNRSTWVCLHAVEAVLLPASPFVEILRRFPVASLQFSKLLSDNLVATYLLLAEMRTKSGSQRESRL